MGDPRAAAAAVRAGTGMVDITPQAGVHLAGGVGRLRPAQTVLDPLYAKAIVFEAGGRKICLVSLDVTIITQEYSDRIRRESARRYGLDERAIMVHATQTHSAPPLGYFMFDPDFPPVPPEMEWLLGGQKAYGDFAAERAVEAVGQAMATEPVQIGAASGVRDGLAFNRRGVMRDGKVCMPWMYSSLDKPLGPTHIRYLEGPTDPEVGVMCVRDEQMRMRALLLHFTCHPVNIYAQPGLAVSADWPGAWSAEMRAAHGASCVPLVVNGCCGNINPWPAFEADFHPDHRRMGRALAAVSEKVLRAVGFSDRAVIDCRLERVPIPLKTVDPARIQAAKEILGKNPQPPWSRTQPDQIEWDWVRAASLVSIEYARRRSPVVEYEIQVFRIGDLALVGLPGEPFVEGQLAIKIGSPAAQTYVAHCCSQYVGYVPTREAFARGGHEVDPSYWAKLAPEALGMIVDKAVAMTRELF